MEGERRQPVPPRRPTGQRLPTSSTGFSSCTLPTQVDIWADADGTLMATFIQSTRFADIENSHCLSAQSDGFAIFLAHRLLLLDDVEKNEAHRLRPRADRRFGNRGDPGRGGAGQRGG